MKTCIYFVTVDFRLNHLPQTITSIFISLSAYKTKLGNKDIIYKVLFLYSGFYFYNVPK